MFGILDRRVLATVMLAVVILTGTAFAGYQYGYETASDEAVTVDLAERKGPVGTVSFDCNGETCDVTVNVTEWGDYESLAVQNITGTYAQTYYIHPNDSSITLEDVPQRDDHYDEVALYVPVLDLSPTDPVWYEYFGDEGGRTQSFSVSVERTYTV